MKKLINHPDAVVSDLLAGFAHAHPQVRYLPDFQVICRRTKAPGKVGLVSGGGSGHEPAHAGYVGQGMLDAAVAGNVFASPGPDRIIEGIKQADTGAGCLMIIKNYSGDIMNFQMAGEMAAMEGITTDYVVVKDDVAVEDSSFSTGRRGIAGTVFVHKIAGAAAQQGKPLGQVKQCGQDAIERIRSMGMAMSPCILPGVGKPNFTLGPDEVEVGMGIHGEPGVARTTLKTAAETAATLVERIYADLDYTGGEVAVMLNGLGGTPLMELYIVYNEVRRLLAERNTTIYRAYVGNYMTALEMSGCSLTLMGLTEALKPLLDAPCDTPAFP